MTSRWGAARRIAKRLHARSVLPARFLLDQTVARLQHGTQGVKIALVSDQAVITSEEQFSPFETYRAELRSRLGVTCLRLHISDVLSAPGIALAQFDVVLLKLGFRTPRREVGHLVGRIREATAGKRLLYFDGDDDLCVQWPEVLPLVDLYVKKHAFSERSRYLRQYVGKSNLTDYVHCTYGHSFAEDPVTDRTDAVPPEQAEKIVVGWSVALDRKITDMYGRIGLVEARSRCNDIVCRAGVPQDWTHYLRRQVAPVLGRLDGKFRVIIPNRRVEPDVYLREMLDSKVCVSPFGYGEICWRDFEAVLCGCLLVKPDMGHVETYPDIFQPHRTYVPVRWDLADLEEVCSHYVLHDEERNRIVSAAQAALREVYGQGGFLKRAAALLSRAGVTLG